MEIQTHKVNSTLCSDEIINFYAERTLFDTPDIDFYMDNKLSNSRKLNMQEIDTQMHVTNEDQAMKIVHEEATPKSLDS